jgi:hypothetical protein
VGLLAALMGLLLLQSATAQKQKVRPVSDELKLFSEKAIDEANAIIARIKETHHKDLVIETKEKGVPAKEAEKWANERYDTLGLDGVYIIITKEPRHFEVVAGIKTREKGYFTQDDVQEVVKILRSNLGKNSDEALLKVAKYTLNRMNRQLKTPDDFKQLVGEWLGPPVEVDIRENKDAGIKEGKTKGRLYLRFSEILNKPYLDLGYTIRPEEGAPVHVFRNYRFEFKEIGKSRQMAIRGIHPDEKVVLTLEPTDDTLKITSSGKIAAPDIPGLVDPSGEWKRMGRK